MTLQTRTTAAARLNQRVATTRTSLSFATLSSDWSRDRCSALFGDREW